MSKSTKTRKLEKSELIKLVTELNRRMEDFEDSVNKLRDLKDSILEMDDNIAQQAIINKTKIDQINREFEDNKIRAVNNAVKDLGKVLISEEELDELKNELLKIREQGRKELQDKIELAKSNYEEKLTHALDVKQLQHDCDTAKLKAEVETYKKEVENLNNTLNRMADELKSQKQLTSEIACASSRNHSQTTVSSPLH